MSISKNLIKIMIPYDVSALVDSSNLFSKGYIIIHPNVTTDLYLNCQNGWVKFSVIAGIECGPVLCNGISSSSNGVNPVGANEITIQYEGFSNV